jgi:SAM-dependent methyltransferase
VSRDFSPFVGSYREDVRRSIAFAGVSHQVFIEAKGQTLLEVVRRHQGPTSTARFLDVGCGIGLIAAEVIPHAGALVGVDLSEDVVAEASRRNPAGTFHAYDGVTLPFPDDSFDVTFSVCVLHHVEPDHRSRFTAELRRVTRRGGQIVIFEHNPLNPLTRLAVHRCAFDEGVVLLGRAELVRRLEAAGLNCADSGYLLFAPWTGPRTRRLERFVRRVPLGAQYFVSAVKP